MGSRTNQAIDLTIDKKLNSSFILKSPRKQLFELTRYCNTKKTETSNSESFLANITPFATEQDEYNNEVCNFLNYRLAKTQSKFNLLKMFKPGEILSTVLSN